MPGIPSSQFKNIRNIAAQDKMRLLQFQAVQQQTTVYSKVLKLRAMTKASADPLQQLQSEIIENLYDMVRQAQIVIDHFYTFPQYEQWEE